jgi:hypothetical protein
MALKTNVLALSVSAGVLETEGEALEIEVINSRVSAVILRSS